MTNLLRVIKYGWMGFIRNRLVSTATVGIMILALFVVSSLMILDNITETFISQLQSKVDISVYFDAEADETGILKLQYDLEAREDVSEVEYVSRDDALASFKDRHRDNELLMASLAELNNNPFQASLNIKAHESSQLASISSFVEGSSAASIIDKVNFKENEVVIQKLNSITSSIDRIGLFFTFALSLIVVLITFNTIRLVIYNSRDEISIMKLVGASDWFVRGPFIVTGALYGAIASITIWLLVFFILWIISEKVGSVFPGTDVLGYWTGSLISTLFMLLLFGVGLGIVSSLVAIRRYLRA